MSGRPKSIKQIAWIFEQLKAKNQSPTTELEYTNPFTLLVAVVLSAQMTDKGVNKATRALFAAADNPVAMLQLGEQGVKEYIKSINFNNAKARNVIALSRILLESCGGKVPDNEEVLTTLPGVGRKTAKVILNTVYGKPVMAVDTHVFRVAHRVGLSHAATPDTVGEELETIIPLEYLVDAHHWLILHGRYTCKARKPECGICEIAAECDYYESVLRSE